MNAWTNIKAIMKRELGGYFTSPVAYVFLVIFLLLTGFFTFTVGNFFERGEASLVSFFTWHPWLYLFLVPAAGMRLWSEERRLGTLELLLTMPITTWQAIVGKFLASWLFLGIALALTFPVVDHGQLARQPGQRRDPRRLRRQPAARRRLSGDQLHDLGDDAQPGHQLHRLGDAVPVPDPRRLHAGHRSAGALGEPGVVQTIAAFSVMTHFESFQRGVIDLRDVVFFAVGDGFRAVHHRRGHSRPSRRLGTGHEKKHLEHLLYSAGGVAALVVILIAANFIISSLNPARRPDAGQRLHAVAGHQGDPRASSKRR